SSATPNSTPKATVTSAEESTISNELKSIPAAAQFWPGLVEMYSAVDLSVSATVLPGSPESSFFGNLLFAGSSANVVRRSTGGIVRLRLTPKPPGTPGTKKKGGPPNGTASRTKMKNDCSAGA